MTSLRAKGNAILDSGLLVDHIQGTFEFIGFIGTLGSFGVLVCNLNMAEICSGAIVENM